MRKKIIVFIFLILSVWLLEDLNSLSSQNHVRIFGKAVHQCDNSNNN